MNNRKSFTLIEILVVLIVIAILAAIAIPIYNNKVQDIKNDICAANEEALLAAEYMYDLKYDQLAVSVAWAWQDSGTEALAFVREDRKRKGDYIYLAYESFQKVKYFLADIFSLNAVHATLRDEIADKRILICPAADPSSNFVSYTINRSAVLNGGAPKRWSELLDTDIIILDCNSDGSLATNRHQQGGVRGAIVMFKAKIPALITEQRTVERVGSRNETLPRGEISLNETLVGDAPPNHKGK